ncbi:hypothetical protein [Shinella sp.]|uniref:hypothetical protein n=1 Tax=Shinella sp. TaxID=1870904 RepID=UPI0039E53FD8
MRMDATGFLISQAHSFRAIVYRLLISASSMRRVGRLALGQARVAVTGQVLAFDVRQVELTDRARGDGRDSHLFRPAAGLGLARRNLPFVARQRLGQRGARGLAHVLELTLIHAGLDLGGPRQRIRP